MLSSAIPSKFPLTFGKNAAPQFIRTIPTPSQQGINPGAASLNDGFPPVTFEPTNAGGIPPDGRDFNGILNQLSAWCQWLSGGGAGAIPYDSSFASSIGGYPKGAWLAAVGVAGYYWISTADNNLNNPDTGGANWIAFNIYGTLSTGDVKLSFKTVADPGWILMNDGSIGDASSNATTLASALTQPLFTLMYNNIVDTWAPIQTSGGGATTRGAQGTAATAYGNHCRLVLPKTLGRALAVAGAGASLTSRALGQSLGEETHTLTAAELAPHQHTLPNQVWINGVGGSLGGSGNSNPLNGLLTDSGVGVSGNPHNNMQPSSFLTAMVAL